MHFLSSYASYESQSVSGNKLKKEARLDEDDELWRDMSHMHIADTANKILSEFNRFMITHRLVESNVKFGRDKSLKEVSEAIRVLPEYQDLLSKVSENGASHHVSHTPIIL